MSSAPFVASRVRAISRMACCGLALVLTAPPAIAGDAALQALGSKLFADQRLSADGTISCASCHDPSKGFTDGRALPVGIAGMLGTRNAPGLLGVREQDSFLWDGRHASLEAQVLDPFTNAREHGLRSVDELLRRLEGLPDYREAFSRVFGSPRPSEEQVRSALATFVRAIDPGPSRFDRWQRGDGRALTDRERRGFEIFRGPAQCASCHSIGGERARFTDNSFHSVGVGAAALGDSVAEAASRAMKAGSAELPALITADPAIAALGRFNVTRRPSDIGKYRTPSLRNVALTAPYMHDGSIPSLEAAVDQEIYYRGTQQGRPLALSAEDKASLVAFLRSLTSESLERAKGSP